jgi:hypothetical protein
MTKGEELVLMVNSIFNGEDFFSSLPLDSSTCLKFFKQIQKGYKDNPYHNKTHAADIT